MKKFLFAFLVTIFLRMKNDVIADSNSAIGKDIQTSVGALFKFMKIKATGTR